MTRLAAAALALAACSGETGVISVSLATAPGSTLLDDAHTLRLTITNPRRVVMAERGSGGFSLDVELPSDGAPGAIVVEAFAADGSLVASGASPELAFTALTGRIVVYMAAPNTVGAAPAQLEPARSELGVAALPYGALFAGGRLATGAPSDALSIYNAYDHSLGAAMPMPAPRSGIAVGVGGFGVYLFGGGDETDAPTSTLWRYETTIAPIGGYFDYGDKVGFARAGERMLATADEHFLITGTPAAELLGLGGSLVTRDDVTALPTAGATVLGTDGHPATIFVGATDIVHCRGTTCATLDVPGRSGASVVVLPGGKAGVFCGGDSALRIDAATGAVETMAGIPAVARTDCAVAATTRHVIVAGGTPAAGGSEPSVEIYDAVTLAPIAMATLTVPRTKAQAIALANGQILIAGGVDAAGAPIATLELFTPAHTP